MIPTSRPRSRTMPLPSRMLAAALLLLTAAPESTAQATAGAPAAAAEQADLVLHNGRIVTVDDALGTVQSLAAKGQRILAVGSDLQMQKHIGPKTKVIDLRGRLAIPGFIEGHAHFVGLGDSKTILDLTKVRSWAQVVDMVAAAVAQARPGEWIRGRGWHQEKWEKVPQDNVEGFPTHDSLSAVSPDNPVSLTHASGHASFFNKKAMDLAGITKDTANPSGGEILKNAAGEPIGVFRETASDLVGRFISSSELARARTPAETTRRKIRLAAEECLRKGVTSFQDAGSSFSTVDQLRAAADAGELGVRLWVMIRCSTAQLERRAQAYRMIGHANHHLTVRAVKRSIDGALGSRGAWLLEPYSDSPGSTGLATASIEDTIRWAKVAAANGYQVCVHAIGDRANRETLDIYEKVLRDREDGRKLRWRIEHAQHLHPDDIPRFGQLGVIASMQGVHCTSDAPYVVARLGEKRAREGAYAWQSLLRSGAVVTNGTDAPVEDVDPIASYHATVSRKLGDGSRFYPAQRMSRMEALKSYTLWCAYAAFEEDLKGSLTPGKLADLAVLSQDILTVDEDRIPQTEVLYTIVGGEVRYQAR